MIEDSRARASCFPASLKSKKKNARCPVPVLQMPLTSWIIVELADGRELQLSAPKKRLIDNIPKDRFTRSCCGHGVLLAERRLRSQAGRYTFSVDPE